MSRPGRNKLNSNNIWTQLAVGDSVAITDEMIAKYQEFKFILTYDNKVLGEATYPTTTNIISALNERTLLLGGYSQSTSNCAMFGIKKTSDRIFRSGAGWYLNYIAGDWITPTIVLFAR